MKTIRKVLVANRGEIARRVFRTCRGMGIATVAVFSEPDRQAAFVGEADEAVPLGGAKPLESYLRAEAFLEAARRTGADAVHPGYGFLSENAEFARRCEAAGLVFIGPTAESIAALGSKTGAKALMSAAGVPVLPGVEIHGLEGRALQPAAQAIGYPVLVKAVAGGGGRGMRIVLAPEQIEASVAAARREAAGAFGDDTLFLERYLEAPRHVEMQILGDREGRVVHLFERECSIQRRHQKILEESPSTAVDEALRERMGAAAVAAGRAVGYVGAGTVEFLLAPGGEFYFLEMNTRLQVEHPVTECLTGLDLVRLQILVAQGEPLPEEARRPARQGHAIEARLYAEDPERDLLPTSGTLHRFRILAGPGLRVDSGVEDGTVVGTDYDPLLAKLIAHAPTRAEAAARLAAALSGAHLHGLVTNRDLLVGILRHPEFRAGATDTHFLERHPPDRLGAPREGPEVERLHAVAAALAASVARRAAAPALGFLPSGWRNNPSQLQSIAFEARAGRIEVGYAWRGDEVAVWCGGGETERVRVQACRPDLAELEQDGVRRLYQVHPVGDVHYVDSALGHTALLEIERFPLPAGSAEPGSLRSPLPGRVTRVEAGAGQEVRAGAVLVVIEAMKMEHQVTAPHDGRLAALRVREGQQVEAGEVLAVLEESTS